MLLLSQEEDRGVDSRFRKDGVVLITSQVSSYHDLQQMVGRSSRSRGVCEGTLYSIGSERPAQVLERLKRSSATVLLDLERLLILLEGHSHDKLLMRQVREASEKGTPLRSLQ